jgi:hypothetical protein
LKLERVVFYLRPFGRRRTLTRTASTVDKLSGEEQQTLASLTSAVNDFVNKTSASMSALEDKAKAIIHQLPFTKNYPQVVSYLPQYVSKQDFNDDGTIRVRLDGDFIDVTRPRYTMLIHHQSLIVRCQCPLIIRTNDWLQMPLKSCRRQQRITLQICDLSIRFG